MWEQRQQPWPEPGRASAALKDDDALRTFLLSQDVIYAGGGNTANLLAVWRGTAWTGCCAMPSTAGTLLCGISAGADCWAEGSHTDSFGPLTHLPDGLGLLSGSICPYYDSEPGRRASCQAAVADRGVPSVRGTCGGAWGLAVFRGPRRSPG
ncbi:Type 1 glutamine amidotransferase-like domain-containing protein [Streptomyces minutiscleroticus]|uniref:Type 1 glutamine amidotransferase-like domain-containing protein n=1 Tax=Streptomyces minutiscleroticus TaxID=68238 RepID=UPI003320C2CC